MTNEENPSEIKTLFQRHLVDTEQGKKFNFSTCVSEIEAMFETDRMKIANLEKAMSFFVNWFEEQEAKKTKIILPENNSIIV